MCSIAGLIEKKSSSDRTSVYRGMLKGIQHRGPDGEGNWISQSSPWEVFLGHQRLAIIDIEGGTQPFGKNFKEKLVFNGEIFNFFDLKKKLEEERIQFSTRSDTEVLFHWLRKKKSLNALNGMFAFAFWNEDTQTLLLARDPSGIKPLYYSFLPDGGIIFASELKSILAHPQVSEELDQEGIQEYFFFDYFPAPKTLFKKIFKLSPGHFLEWQKGKVSTPTSYFEIQSLFKNSFSPKDQESIQQEVEKKLVAAVGRQLISDVPVGVFLSGGLDSSLIASLAVAQSPQKIKTFSIGFYEKDFDETPYSSEVAHLLKTEHHHEYFDETKLLSEFENILKTLDEPLADPSYLPTFILSRLASQKVKVALGGDGGDELWAGYPTYFAHRWAKPIEKIPKPLLQTLQTLVGQLKVNPRHQSFEWKAKRFLQRFESMPISRHLHWMSGSSKKTIENIFHQNFSNEILKHIENKLGNIPLPHLFLALDFITYLPGAVLTKVDRASMANGLEVRPPFLDQEFIATSFQVPFSLKYRGKENKWLLKKIAKGKIPESILKRPKKGFGIPLSRWIRGPLKPQVLALLEDRPFLESIGANAENLRTLWLDELKQDASKTFWSLLVLKKVISSYD